MAFGNEVPSNFKFLFILIIFNRIQFRPLNRTKVNFKNSVFDGKFLLPDIVKYMRNNVSMFFFLVMNSWSWLLSNRVYMINFSVLFNTVITFHSRFCYGSVWVPMLVLVPWRLVKVFGRNARDIGSKLWEFEDGANTIVLSGFRAKYLYVSHCVTSSTFCPFATLTSTAKSLKPILRHAFKSYIFTKCMIDSFLPGVTSTAYRYRKQKRNH